MGGTRRHAWRGERRPLSRLLQRARKALRPGGLLAIHELERPQPGNAGARAATLGALVFMTAMGARTYTAPEIGHLTAQAGFVRVRVRRPIRIGTGLVLAERDPASGAGAGAA